jgi:hypothetical protein
MAMGEAGRERVLSYFADARVLAQYDDFLVK